MNDKNSHLMTKLKSKKQFIARDKLGRLIVEKEIPIKLNEQEYFSIMTDKNDWVLQLIETSWKKVQIEKQFPN